MHDGANSQLPTLLTKAEVAKFLRVSYRTVTNYQSSGQLVACKIGGKVLFDRDVILKSINTFHAAQQEVATS